MGQRIFLVTISAAVSVTLKKILLLYNFQIRWCLQTYLEKPQRTLSLG